MKTRIYLLMLTVSLLGLTQKLNAQTLEEIGWSLKFDHAYHSTSSGSSNNVWTRDMQYDPIIMFGQITSITTSSLGGTSSGPQSRESFNYGSNGKPVTVLYEKVSGINWVKSALDSIYYNADSTLKLRKHFGYSGNSLGLANRNTYTYDTTTTLPKIVTLTRRLQETYGGGNKWTNDETNI